MIQLFKCKDSLALFEGKNPRRFKAFVSVAERKLAQLDAAQTLEFLKAPPGNHLEALKGDRKGQYSIRINDQWRICFMWSEVGPTEVEIVDYH
jgi:toxin HigB-1